MRPLFPSPPPSPRPPDPDRAVLVRRALQDRLLETLRYLADEVEVRRVVAALRDALGLPPEGAVGDA